MCTPGVSHSRRSTGSAELVAVTTMPAPSTACWTLAQPISLVLAVISGPSSASELAGLLQRAGGHPDLGQRPGARDRAQVRPEISCAGLSRWCRVAIAPAT